MELPFTRLDELKGHDRITPQEEFEKDPDSCPLLHDRVSLTHVAGAFAVASR